MFIQIVLKSRNELHSCYVTRNSSFKEWLFLFSLNSLFLFSLLKKQTIDRWNIRMWTLLWKLILSFMFLTSYSQIGSWIVFLTEAVVRSLTPTSVRTWKRKLYTRFELFWKLEFSENLENFFYINAVLVRFSSYTSEFFWILCSSVKLLGTHELSYLRFFSHYISLLNACLRCKDQNLS